MSSIADGETLGGTFTGLTMEGTPTTVPGILGNALRLNGQTKVKLGSLRSSCFWLPDLCPNGFTLSLWLKLYNLPADGQKDYIANNGGQTTHSFGILLLIDVSQNLDVAVKTKQKWFNIEAPVVQVDTWYHITVRCHDTQGITVSIKIKYNVHKKTFSMKCISIKTAQTVQFLLHSLKSSFKKNYVHHHDLVDRYKSSVTPVMTDLFVN